MDVRHEPGVTVVAPSGELDFVVAAELRRQLEALLRQGHVQLTIDLGDVTFLDATTLGVFVTVLKEARARGGNVVIRNPRPLAIRVLRVTGLDELFGLDGDGSTR
ncbi:MAG TPA: STAS domain-containing protein [Acidimicrobiales bacterium]|nr:STAS domain-containing protein [Acidimicrobiales bacterium]